MFDNIGGKIKGLASAVCFIGIAISVISGIAFFFSGPLGIVGGILIGVVGSILSWIGSFFAYGFGELIENSEKTKKDISAIKRHINFETAEMKTSNEDQHAVETKEATQTSKPKMVKGKILTVGLQYTGECEICGQTKTIRQVAVEDGTGEYIKNICAQCISENYI